MSKHIIYCWTGTGNSFADAKTIAAALGGAELRPMGGEIPRDAETIGFIYPTYYWTAPAPVMNFIRGADLPKGAYYYAVATCAAIAVNAVADLDALLREKGVFLSYYAKNRHVGNYITVYPRFPSPTKRVPAAAERAKVIARDVAARKVLPPARRSVPGAVQHGFHAATSFGDFGAAYDKGFHLSDACISCGLCAKVCPAENIVMEKGKPVFRHHCEHCMACIQFCPKEAINYKNTTQKRQRYHNPAVSAGEVAELLKIGRGLGL